MSEITKAELAVLEAASRLREQGELLAALEKIQALLLVSPELAVAYNYQGTLYHALSRYQEARQSYQAAIQYQPNYIDAYYNLGLVYLKLNDRASANRVFEIILSLSPAHAGARFQAGRLCMESDNYQGALAYFHGLVQDYPNHAESFANLAACYLRLRRVNEAVSAYETAILLDPKDTQALFNLGVIYSKLGREDLARTYYLKVLSLNPRQADAHVNLAALYWKARLKEDAILHYRKAQELRPDDALIEHALRVLGQDPTLVETSPLYARALFNAYAETYDTHLKEALHYRVPEAFEAALQQVDDKPRVYDKVLDLGCGTGLCGPLLRARARHLIGLDVSPEMLQKAKDKGDYDVLVEGEAVWYLNTQVNTFQLIAAGDLFVYIGELEPLFKALHQALTPAGRLLFNVEMTEPAEGRFLLEASGRFQHDPGYLHTLSVRFGFSVLYQEKVVLRREAGEPVWGLVCLWER